MANYSRIKDSTRRRAADIVTALEAEIAAHKQARLDAASLERPLSCFLSLKESDLPRFRLAEAIIKSNSVCGPGTALTLRNLRCHKEDSLLPTADHDLRLIEMALGRAPLTKYSGNSLEEQTAALSQAVQAHLQAGRRVLLLSCDEDASDSAVEALLRSGAQLMDTKRDPTSVIELRSPDDCKSDATKSTLSLARALSAAQSHWTVHRRAQETAAAALQETISGIASLLTARQALSEEIADLNTIHQRCDQLFSYSQSLSVHIRELERQTPKAAPKEAISASTWHRFRHNLLGTQPISATAAGTDLQQARRRRHTVDQEADQMALEMVSRQAFIVDTTRQLLRQLRKYAPTFGQAARLLTEQRQRLTELNAAMRHSTAPPTQADVLQSARLVCTTVDHLYQPILAAQRFDLVVIVRADQLSTLSLYWAASLAKTAVIISAAGAKWQLCPLSGHQSAGFWLGPAAVWEPPVAACGIQDGWVPAGRVSSQLPPGG